MRASSFDEPFREQNRIPATHADTATELDGRNALVFNRASKSATFDAPANGHRSNRNQLFGGHIRDRPRLDSVNFDDNDVAIRTHPQRNRRFVREARARRAWSVNVRRRLAHRQVMMQSIHVKPFRERSTPRLPKQRGAFARSGSGRSGRRSAYDVSVARKHPSDASANEATNRSRIRELPTNRTDVGKRLTGNTASEKLCC